MSFSTADDLGQYDLGLQGDGEALLAEGQQNYPTSSFTPLNARQPPKQYVNPTETLYYSEDTFDVPSGDTYLSEIPSKPAKKGKKRPPAQAKKGRAVSLGAVWNYTDEEDVVSELVVTTKPAKRVKSAPAKKGNGNKAPYKVQSREPDDGDVFEAFDVVEAADEEASMNSQLTTPPDSNKRKPKKGGSVATKPKKGRLPSFKSLTVTKSVAPQEKEQPNGSSVISYQGWTSTQDAVKHNGLAQTTLDKLAAFRYNPKPTIFATPNTRKTQESQPGEQVDINEPELESTGFNGNDTLKNGSSTQFIWHLESNDPFLNQPALERPQGNKCAVDFDEKIEADQTEAGTPSLHTIEHMTLDSDGGIAHPSASEAQIVGKQLQYHQYREPASSEAMVPDHSKDSIKADTEIKELQGHMSIVPAIVPEVRGYPEKQVAQCSGTNVIEVNPVSHEEPVPILPVNFEFDEFDDGLDDDDIMAISTDNLVLKTARVAVLPAAIASTSSESKIVSVIDMPDVPHLPIIDSDDDEYLMDAGEDDRMHEVLEHPGLVIENHHAPTSLQNEIEFQEEYDSSLQFSPPSANQYSDPLSPNRIPGTDPQEEFEDWAFMNSELDDVMRQAELRNPPATVVLSQPQMTDHTKAPATKTNAKTTAIILDDSHEYEPLGQFVRPEFPEIVRDRCPIVGVSSQSFLRTCFRIGELFKEGQKCRAAGQDTIIELFARVNFSSRDAGTQHFRFMDLWSDYPPFPTGILTNYKTSSLADSESFALVGEKGKGKMARCLGRVKRDRRCDTGWIIDIINIRETDWEEIRWTKRIVTAGSEGTGLLKL
ncbi:hypothetical protein HYFRA_00012134 [Hymenoscyphus fraxineus]|uniref:Uncharacterized protein n=1 Tax=Hymenoscyphus fraxineus TaxID=746836 RepID=A0A9N9L8M7_9HELO|nr:hypothetical protein HYFRA_00012134 [Hymenoscyphus fraxineus]